MKFYCKNLLDTKKLAQILGKLISQNGCFISLFGEIGVGKTAFTKFLLEQIGVKQAVTSPSFVILNEYHAKPGEATRTAVSGAGAEQLMGDVATNGIDERSEQISGGNLTGAECASHLPVYHFDLYRLEDVGVKTILSELVEYSRDKVITLVEWADFGKQELPVERINLSISYDADNENARILEFVGVGEKYKETIQKLEELWMAKA